MSTPSTPSTPAPSSRKVDWTIMVVGLGCTVPHCSCAETVAEQPFAYTIGLWAKHGLPELLVHARPDAGDDDGGRWYFSDCDLVRMLNGFAVECLDGRLGPGSTTARPVDDGAAHVTYVFGDPAPARAAGALLAPAAADVIRLTWSLHLNRAARRARPRTR